MLTGAFGLGGLSAAYTGNLDATNNALAPGFYHFSAATVAGIPPKNFGWQHLSHRRRAPGGGEFQTIIQESTNDAFIRSRAGGSWTDWSMFYGQKNVLDNVEMIAGLPTGALIERGSNANGTYLRYADGTQICW